MKRYKHVKKQTIDGFTFDSGREAERYQELKLLAKAGEIRRLDVHVPFQIVIGGVEVRYPSGRKMTYICDFHYYDNKFGYMVIEDVKMKKQHRTGVYILKRALMHTMGFIITEVT